MNFHVGEFVSVSTMFAICPNAKLRCSIRALPSKRIRNVTVAVSLKRLDIFGLALGTWLLRNPDELRNRRFILGCPLATWTAVITGSSDSVAELDGDCHECEIQSRHKKGQDFHYMTRSLRSVIPPQY